MSSILKNKTFEVPACTVCMEEMTENLASIGCGHIFHSLWYAKICILFSKFQLVLLKVWNTEVLVPIVVKGQLLKK
jgi:hypothetical protein